MKKISIFIFLLIVGLITTKAQEIDKKQYDSVGVSIENLTGRLNNLQRDYDFLSCQYEIYRAQSELKSLGDEANIKSNAILINCYHSKYNHDLYVTYRDNYDSYVVYYDSLKETVTSLKDLVSTKILYSDFSESQVELLKHCSDVLDKALISAEHSINYYKIILDLYKGIR